MRRKSQIKGVDASTERENLKNLPSRTKQPEKGSTPFNIFRGTLKLETSHLNLLRDLDSARICMKKVSKKCNKTKICIFIRLPLDCFRCRNSVTLQSQL